MHPTVATAVEESRQRCYSREARRTAVWQQRSSPNRKTAAGSGACSEAVGQ